MSKEKKRREKEREREREREREQRMTYLKYSCTHSLVQIHFPPRVWRRYMFLSCTRSYAHPRKTRSELAKKKLENNEES